MRTNRDGDKVNAPDDQLASQATDLRCLVVSEGLDRIDRAAAPGLHLDGNTALGVGGDDVDLATAYPMIAMGDGQAAAAQKASGDRLSEASEGEPVA